MSVYLGNLEILRTYLALNIHGICMFDYPRPACRDATSFIVPSRAEGNAIYHGVTHAGNNNERPRSTAWINRTLD